MASRAKGKLQYSSESEEEEENRPRVPTRRRRGRQDVSPPSVVNPPTPAVSTGHGDPVTSGRAPGSVGRGAVQRGGRGRVRAERGMRRGEGW